MYDDHNEVRDLSGKSAGEIASLLAINIKCQDATRLVGERQRRRLEKLHRHMERFLAILAPNVPLGGMATVILSGETPQVLTLHRGCEGEITGFDVVPAVLSVDFGTPGKPSIWPESARPGCEILGIASGTAG